MNEKDKRETSHKSDSDERRPPKRDDPGLPPQPAVNPVPPPRDPGDGADHRQR